MQVVMRTALHLPEPPEEKVDPESKTTHPEGLDLGNIDDLSDSLSQLLQHVDLFVSVISRISEVRKFLIVFLLSLSVLINSRFTRSQSLRVAS
jgi:hypothetical protein